jgi:hypothetical protein
MKKLLLLGACLVALASSPVMAQASEPEVLVLRIDDGNGYMVIAWPDGKTEELQFNALSTKKGLVTSSAQFQKLIASLYKQGYVLKSTFAGQQAVFTTLVFIKEK